MVFGAKREDLTPGANLPQRNTPTTETHFCMPWAEIHASHGKLWMHWRNQRKYKIKHARVQLHPYAHPTPILVATIFCMWGRTVDVIKRARFHVNRFWGFGAPSGRKWPSPIDLAHRPYNSVRTNVLYTVITIVFTRKARYVMLFHLMLVFIVRQHAPACRARYCLSFPSVCLSVCLSLHHVVVLYLTERPSVRGTTMVFSSPPPLQNSVVNLLSVRFKCTALGKNYRIFEFRPKLPFISETVWTWP